MKRARRMQGTVDRALRTFFIALASIVLLSWVGLAIVHLFTGYDINQTSGAWLSFAYALHHGAFYPPPIDHGFYSGTRYMPLFPALHALLAFVTGEYLASGKLATLLATVAIIVALFNILRPKLKNAPLAAAFAVLPLATFIGHKGSLTIRSDVLPLALSLFALLLYEREKTKRGLWGSALLAGLAPLAKFTALHALTAAAIDLFFVKKRRKEAVLYGAIGGGVFVAGVILFELASHHGLSQNFSAAALGPGENKRGLLDALHVYAWYVLSDRAYLFLLPWALISAVRKPKDVYVFYFVLQAVIAAGFFFDVGAEYNHLIDLVAATVILAARLAAPEAPAALRRATLVCAAIACLVGLGVHHRSAWEAPENSADLRRSLEDDLGLAGKKLLTQDPTVAVLLDQKPVVADDFQYRVLVAKGIVDPDELSARILHGEFDRIVLLNPPEPDDPLDPTWAVREFGAKPARAIRDAYVLDRHVGKYYVYRPRAELTP